MIALIFAFAAAVLDWVGVARDRRPFEYVGKPAVIMLLIVWVLSQVRAPMPALGVLFLVALFASLAGDILLMVPGDRFLGGLAAFLVANLAYIAALNARGLPGIAAGLALAGVVLVVAGAVLGRLARGLQASGRGWVFPFLAFYGLAQAGMLWSAATTPFRAAWPLAPGLAVAAGGVLFFASDATNAWNRFMRPVPGGRLTTHVLYHLGQIALTVGILGVLSAG